MTDEQINRSVAVACNWKPIFAAHPDPWLVCWQTPSGETASQLPNFCNDLNAMHEAEEHLKPHELWAMDKLIERGIERYFFRATARQRAEAFLRVVGKWEEGK